MMDDVAPLLVLQARAEARAILFAAGELTLQDAVDGCQQYAEASGLLAEIGQDKVQEIMAQAFAPIQVPDLIEEATHMRAAASTIAAAEHLFKENDARRWREWLARRTDDECADILKRIEQRRRGA